LQCARLAAVPSESAVLQRRVLCPHHRTVTGRKQPKAGSSVPTLLSVPTPVTEPIPLNAWLARERSADPGSLRHHPWSHRRLWSRPNSPDAPQVIASRISIRPACVRFGMQPVADAVQRKFRPGSHLSYMPIGLIGRHMDRVGWKWTGLAPTPALDWSDLGYSDRGGESCKSIWRAV
jgi:hypothetical protein